MGRANGAAASHRSEAPRFRSRPFDHDRLARARRLFRRERGNAPPRGHGGGSLELRAEPRRADARLRAKRFRRHAPSRQRRRDRRQLPLRVHRRPDERPDAPRARPLPRGGARATATISRCSSISSTASAPTRSCSTAPIATTRARSFLLERRMPFTSHGRTLTHDMHYAWIDTDGHAAFAKATRLLLDLGHTDFAFFGPTQPYAYAHFRQRGLEDALRERGLALTPERILHRACGRPGIDREGGRKAARPLAASDRDLRRKGQVRARHSRSGAAARHRDSRRAFRHRLRRPAGRRLCGPAAFHLRAEDDRKRRDRRRHDRRSPGARAAGGRPTPDRIRIHRKGQPRPGAGRKKRRKTRR